MIVSSKSSLSTAASTSATKDVLFDSTVSVDTYTETSFATEVVLIADVDKNLLPGIMATPVKYVKVVSDVAIAIKVNTETIAATKYLEIQGDITALTASGGASNANVKVFVAG